MKEFFALCRKELKKLYQMTISYPLNIIISIMSFVAISVVLLFGMSSIFNDSFQFYSLLFSPVVIGCVSSMSNSYKFDTMIGAVEQIANSRFGLHKVLFARYCIDFMVSILPSIALMIITRFFFSFPFNLVLTLITFVVLFVECYFLGIILLGLVLVYRKVDSIFSIVNFLLSASMLAVLLVGVNNIPLISYFIPFSNIAVFPAIPFSQENVSALSVVMLILNIIASSFVAFIVYKKLYKKSLKLGTIGQY